MKLVNNDIGLTLTVGEELMNYLFEIGEKHYPKEFGGFLIGYYSENLKNLNITDTILPKKFKSTKFSFERDSTGLEYQLRKIYEEKPRKYYIGEWHTHPDCSPKPSITDLQAIESIIQYPKIVIKSPVFLILSISKKSKDFAFYVPLKNKLYKYEQQN